MCPAYFSFSYMYMYVQIYIMLCKCSDYINILHFRNYHLNVSAFIEIEFDYDFNQYVHVCNSYLVFIAYRQTGGSRELPRFWF